MTLAGVTDAKKDHMQRRELALTVTLAMIETRTALDNLDAIAGTEGIDVLFVGPSDLSIALTSDGKEAEPHSALVEREARPRSLPPPPRRTRRSRGSTASMPIAPCSVRRRRGFRFCSRSAATFRLPARIGAAAQLKALEIGKMRQPVARMSVAEMRELTTTQGDDILPDVASANPRYALADKPASSSSSRLKAGRSSGLQSECLLRIDPRRHHGGPTPASLRAAAGLD